MKCRFCEYKDFYLFADLGHTAVSNAFVTEDQKYHPETIYPLKAFVCKNCFLVQVDEHEKRENIFTQEYVYFSSISKSWLEHSRQYVEEIIPKLGLNDKSMVVEIASNDGYLLQYFKDKQIKCLGIEPTRSTAEESIRKGIETRQEFFGKKVAEDLVQEQCLADLIIGNNVLPHDPNLNDFVSGLKILLKPTGTITLEFPHLLKLIENSEFDTIYQEHFSYFSVNTLVKIFDHHQLKVYRVEELKTHGGSIRIFATHKENMTIEVDESVAKVKNNEYLVNLDNVKGYENFQEKINKIKNDLLIYLLTEKQKGAKIAAFGAAAKGNTFINYCGIKPDLIEFVVDETPIKQGKLLPQSHIPVRGMEYLKQEKPDIVVIIPWNFKKEIVNKLGFVKDWGAKMVTYIPQLEVL